jgi:hypothetical protein
MQYSSKIPIGCCLPALNARIQAILPSHSMLGRFGLRKKTARRTASARNGPKIVPGAFFAPKGAPPPDRDPFYNRVTELQYFKDKFNGEDFGVTVLFGPRDTGTTVRSAFACLLLPGR